MKNRTAGYLRMALILCAAFNVVVFLLPFAHTPTFWTAYAFSMAAVILVCIFDYLALRETEGSNSFYGLPAAMIGNIYLLIQFVLGVLTMALAFLPKNVMTVVFIVMLAVYLVLILAVFIGKASSESADRKISEKAQQLRKRSGRDISR